MMHYCNFFFKMGHSRPLFLYFRLFNFNVQFVDKVCRCWDSNHGSLVSEATALPTEPPPLPFILGHLNILLHLWHLERMPTGAIQ